VKAGACNKLLGSFQRLLASANNRLLCLNRNRGELAYMHDMRHTPRDGPGLAAGLSPAGSPRFAFEVGQGTRGCLVYFCCWASAREDTRAAWQLSLCTLYLSTVPTVTRCFRWLLGAFSVHLSGELPCGRSVHGGRRTKGAAPAAGGSV